MGADHVTLQGYGGYQRFYHGIYQRQLGKINQAQLGLLIMLTGEHSNSTVAELLELQDTINILRNS